MDELQEKMGAVLSNPQLMQQIMAMAQSMGASQPAEQNGSPPPQPDGEVLKQLTSLAGKSTVDTNQQALLKALRPYLQKERIHKLERAMRAAKMAQMASGVLGSGALQSLIGR